MYLAFDGGGSKLNAIMFDGELNLRATARAGGVNLTQGSEDDCRANVARCLAELFAEGAPPDIDNVYYTFVGPFRLMREALSIHTRVARETPLNEGAAGVLAGSLKTRGMVALSGTGSDAIYVTDAGTRAVGGWGPILGDEGSGAWIGQSALRAAVRMANGWGDNTLLLDLIMKEWGLEQPWEMVKAVHGASAPFRKVASLTRVVGRAVELGDAAALAIIDEAADYMARQTLCAFEKFSVPADERDVTLCGGAWKTHPRFRERFAALLNEGCPGARVAAPLFEHVCAGACKMLFDERGLSREQAFSLMNARLSAYRIEGSEFI